MRLLRNETETVAKICGRQTLRPNQTYRYNRHCVNVECEEGTLLFHTLTGALALVRFDEDECENREELIAHWFMVPEDFDENTYADSIRQIARALKTTPKYKNHFTILTTTDCNARCRYCFELGERRYSMTPQTARDVAEYIIRVHGGETVSLSWFGGEPLYNREAIDIICEVLRERGVRYKSILTTNGYFLDAETARRAKRDWHIDDVQIAIDGTEKVYNRIKAYIDAVENPYQRVMNNIEAALDAGLIVSVRLNMDAKNKDDLFQLVAELAQRFSNRKNLFVNVILLNAFTGSIHEFETSRVAAEARQALMEKAEALDMMRYGSLVGNLCVNHCGADNDTCEVILPDGRVGKCEHFVDSETVGSIYNEARDQETVRSWKERAIFPECLECALYPRCYNLKKCEWYKNGCKESARSFKIYNLKKQILAAYHKAEKERTEA